MCLICGETHTGGAPNLERNFGAADFEDGLHAQDPSAYQPPHNLRPADLAVRFPACLRVFLAADCLLRTLELPDALG
jgi:hypothetical protein